MEIPVAIKAKKFCSGIRVCRLHSIVVDDDETREDLSLASEEELNKWIGDGDGDDVLAPEQCANVS